MATETPDKDDKTTNADRNLQPDGTQTDAQKARAENEVGKNKRKAERNAAQWTSPEHKTLSGQEIFPEQKVSPSTPNPADDPELKGTRYDPNFKR